MDQKKKKLILVIVFVVLIAGAAIALFQDSLFSSSGAISPEVQAVVDEAAKATVRAPAEPAPTEPPKPTFSKKARPVGGP
jgi:flagellar basal body-associated protein FliL